jgi:outer membrane protein OmpA-like peptidoglycan-associated protein
MGPLRRFAVSALVCASATSATADGLDGERFTPAISAEGGFAHEHPAVPSHLGWGIGIFGNFANDQVVERQGDNTLRRPVDTGVTADLVGSIGLFNRLELGLHVPLHIIYEGDPYATGGTTLQANAGFGDLRIVPKILIVSSGNLERHVLLGMAIPFSLPTGNDDALRGGGGLSIEPRLLFAAHLSRLGLGFDLGYRYRTEHPPTLPWGDEVTLGPWISYALTDALTVRGELIAGKHVNTEVAGADFPVEALAGVDFRATKSVALYGGASFGINDGIGAPDFRAILGLRYRSHVPSHQGYEDVDGDGVLDKDDRCVEEPEDVDGFRDLDGCPEPDNDGDGILDGDDECPELTGDASHRGCPAKTFVKILDGKVIIFGKVQFRTGSADIEKNSEPLLDQIAQAFDANPQAGKIRIDGHTDNVGDPKSNKKLSEQRAEAVKRALVKRGLSSGRLETRGLGETSPIAPNTTGGGRQTNRRVEFIIVGGKS